MSVSPTRTQDIRTTPALATGDPNRQSPLTSHSSKALAMDAPKDEQHSPNGVVTDGHSAPTASVPEELAQYKFPDRKLKRVMEDSSKTPLLLVACGSFSPITHLHLRMFEMVADHVRHKTNYEIVGGYLSPVSDAYKKSGLASADHRFVKPPQLPWSLD